MLKEAKSPEVRRGQVKDIIFYGGKKPGFVHSKYLDWNASAKTTPLSFWLLGSKFSPVLRERLVLEIIIDGITRTVYVDTAARLSVANHQL